MLRMLEKTLMSMQLQLHFIKDSIKDKLLYVDKKITAAQQALLGGPNFHQYLADNGSK